MEKFKVEGVTFYYESQKYYASKCNIKDIDIEKGVDTVVFTAPPSIRYADIKLSKVKKQFPDVTTLIIENKIQHIGISNFLFPNIKNVISKNEMFENGNLLLKRDYGKDGYILLNAFCKGTEELIDLSKVIRVRNYAFEGCRSKNIVNAGNILSMDVKSFSGYVFAMDNDYEKGIKAIGRFLIGIDYSIPVIEIPETVTENACNFDECKIAKEIVLKNDSSIDALHNCHHNAIICDKISIDYDGYISLSSLRTVRYREINVTAKNTAYDSYDGILFDDTGRFLYACPSLYEGEVVIKEGTEYIEDYAFYNVQNITSVKFPDSLKELGNSAFSNCVNLKRIDFGKGLTHIGGSYGTSVFSYCTGIKNIHIPSTIRLIGALAFSNCQLDTITLDEGVEVIDSNAFTGCHIKEITLPKSTHCLKSGCFDGVERIIIKGDVPPGLIPSLIYQYSNGRQYDTLYDIVEITDGENVIFVPKVIQSCDINTFDRRLMYRPLKDTITVPGFINSICDYAVTLEVRQNLSIIIYKHTKDKELRSYLRRASLSIAKRFIINGDEERLVDLLSLDLMTVASMKKILDSVKDAGMTSASAYILSAINNAGGDKKTFKL